MRIRRFQVMMTAAIIAMIVPLASGACHQDNLKLLARVKQTIVELQSMKGAPSIERENEAAHLADLIERINPEAIDNKTLNELIALLDHAPDDFVRDQVAVALGYLGPRARPAVPALLRDIRQTDCLPGELTSAAAARVALERIGVKPPPRNCAGERE